MKQTVSADQSRPVAVGPQSHRGMTPPGSNTLAPAPAWAATPRLPFAAMFFRLAFKLLSIRVIQPRQTHSLKGWL